MSDALRDKRRESFNGYGMSRKKSWKRSQKRSAKRKLAAELRREARE